MNLFKQLWHLLFDFCTVEWNAWKAFNAWVSWNPHLGFAIDFRFDLILPHKADPTDSTDSSWGPEVEFSLGLPWLDFGLNIPNKEWCDGADYQLEVPKLLCLKCGADVAYMMGHRCTGCHLAVELCTCLKAQGSSGILLGDVRLVGSDAEGRPVPLDTPVREPGQQVESV